MSPQSGLFRLLWLSSRAHRSECLFEYSSLSTLFSCLSLHFRLSFFPPLCYPMRASAAWFPPLLSLQTFALAARAGRRVGLRCASFSSTVSTDTAPESSVAQRQKLCRRKTVGTRSSTNVDLDRDDGATSTRGKRTDVSAWALRTYLLKLRVAPRSHEAGEQRPERFSYLSGGGSAPHSSGNDEGRKVREGHRAPSGGEREGGDHVGGVGRPADFATWGRRVRKDRAWKDKDRKR